MMTICSICSGILNGQPNERSVCDVCAQEEGEVQERKEILRQEMQRRLDRIKSLNISAAASALRFGTPCKLDIPNKVEEVMAGGRHLHLPLVFEDAVKWLARVQEVTNSSDIPHQRSILQSEIATQRRLKDAGVKVPMIWLGTVKGPKDTLVSFVEHIEGKPCNPPLSLEDPNIDIIIEDYARFAIALTESKYDVIGSLKGKGNIGPLLNPDFTEMVSLKRTFKTLAKRYAAQIQVTLDRISQKQIFEDDPVTAYLVVVHLGILDLIENDVEMCRKVTRTFVKHADDKGDQIMVDDKGHIVGIIDWELAYFTAKLEAYAAPLAFIDIDMLYSGVNTLAPLELKLAEIYDKLGRQDLADCVRSGKIFQRLQITIGAEPDWVLFTSLFTAMGKRPSVEDTLADWCEKARVKFSSHLGLQALLKDCSSA